MRQITYNTNDMRSVNGIACGILFCYNEEQIIGECIRHYLSQGIDLVVVDNGSTDSSMDIVKVFQKEKENYRGKIIDVLYITTEGFEWRRILHFACDYMHMNLSHYEWILLIDADSFYYSPVKNMSLLEFMSFVKKYNYNIIDGVVYDFCPTEKDDLSIISPLKRMQYWQPYADEPCPQYKIFLYHPTIDFYTYWGHICLRDNARVFIIRFVYKHYKWISYEHGLKKIFEERNPRFVERKENPRGHPQYLGILPLKKDLVKQSQELQRYNKEKLLISRSRLLWIMRFRKFIEILFAFKRWYRGLWFSILPYNKPRDYLKSLLFIFTYDKTFTFRYLSSCAREVMSYIKEVIKPREDLKPTKFSGVSMVEVINQRPYVFGLPRAYHFLTTNFCNARCIFCNQDFNHQSKKEITLQKFKIILSHIPETTQRSFYFSGGGEPMLCQDLFPIIHYVNTSSPRTQIYIVTNGLLIKKYTKELAQSKIYQLEISVHGATSETNSAILHVGDEYDIFENVVLLNEHLKCCKNKMRKVFCLTVSQQNIDEIPPLIEKAAELDVNQVRVNFCRYYPQHINRKDRLLPETSLFFNKKKYNDVILKSKKLAKKLKVSFIHEPLFSHKFRERPCFQPWNTMLIDWEGNIYPCCGGEVWFEKKVKSGEYYFGNLLNEHLSQCWNNVSYVMIRRTCSRYYQENFIPECECCPSTVCLKGPDVKCGHILETKV